MSYEHPLVKEGAIEERAYQVNIAEAAKEVSTLVVLPTGMGKTIIAFLVMADIEQREPDKKILFLAPTKPLVSQHARDIEELLDIGEPVIFTGEVKPDEREELWGENDVIVSTPQVIRNDLMAQRIDLDDVSLVIFDEAHRGVGSYSYVFIGEKYTGLSLGLTASPGSEKEHILEVCENLDFTNVEIRTKYDPDVINYIQEREMKWIDVSLPARQKRIVQRMKSILEDNVKSLQDYGFIKGKRPDRVSRKDILKATREIQAEIHSGGKGSLYNAASIVASCLKLDHAIDQAETQGPDALEKYLEKLKNEADSRGGSKAAKRLMNSSRMKEVIALLKNVEKDHPKVPKTLEIVKGQLDNYPDSKVIVFSSYRYTAQKLSDELSELEGVRPARFVGQTNKEGDKGLKQSEQIQAIDDFESGTYNVLVATSVGEEGLDIPATDLVVFYEPVPSEIRTIQRRGRTARKRKGKVVILITKKTRDEAYYWASKNKEKKMWRNLNKLKKELEGKVKVDESMKRGGKKGEVKEEDYKVVRKKSKKQLKRENLIDEKGRKEKGGQKSLFEFEGKEEKGGVGKEKEEEEVKTVTIDVREQNSRVVRELARKDIKISTSQLSVGDYIISEETAVERKSVDDFLESLMDGRLFTQAKKISQNYQHPVIILEGTGLHERRNISDKAIYGALASLAVDFNIPVITSKDEEETASLITSMLMRKERKKGSYSLRKDKSTFSDRDTKKFILEGLPNVSGTLAERLLEHFGSVRAVFQATEEELKDVKGIGQSTAERIIKIIR
ncbi:MAG: DEAD/DEAH box helicase [Thermoplasmata archaeon]